MRRARDNTPLLKRVLTRRLNLDDDNSAESGDAFHRHDLVARLLTLSVSVATSS